ncbi:MAG: phytase, partial [Calditrichaeota bacterium]
MQEKRNSTTLKPRQSSHRTWLWQLSMALLWTSALLLLSAFLSRLAAQTVSVTPILETDPVPSSGDAADDACIWIHPTDPSQSLIIATDKTSGLLVYDLNGHQLQYLASGEPNNVDLRYNFPLGGDLVALVGVSDRAGKD